MENNRNSDETADQHASARILTRREWVQRMLAGAGSGIAAPAVAAAFNPSPLRAGATTPAEAESEWKPAFFDAHQNQTLIAVAERIVPGSTGAQVNRFLDTAFGAESQQKQEKMVTSLNALEGESLRRFTKSFKDLSANQQDEILTAADSTPPSDPNFEEVNEAAVRLSTPAADPNLRNYFDHLKSWISMAYYSSEAGMKELGWTGENFFENFPGCEHAGSHS